MRYANDEQTVLVGMFNTNSNVKIKIVNLLNDSLVNISDNICVESRHIDGAFLWTTNNIADSALSNGYYNLLYEMYDEEDNKFHGKFIYGGYVNKPVDIDMSALESDITEIKQLGEIINARI